MWECLGLSGCVEDGMDVYRVSLTVYFVYCVCLCGCVCVGHVSVWYRYGDFICLDADYKLPGTSAASVWSLQVTYEHIQRKMPNSAEVNDIKGIEYLTPSRVSALDMVPEEFPSCIDLHRNFRFSGSSSDFKK